MKLVPKLHHTAAQICMLPPLSERYGLGLAAFPAWRVCIFVIGVSGYLLT